MTHTSSLVYNISSFMTCIHVGLEHFLVHDTHILVGLPHFLVYDIQPRYSMTFRRLWHTSSFGYHIYSFMTYILVGLRHFVVYDTHPRLATTFARLWHTSSFVYDIYSFMTHTSSLVYDISSSMTHMLVHISYGMATMSRLLKMIGLFCKRTL